MRRVDTPSAGRDDGCMAQERNLTRTQRALVAAAIWIIVGPLVVGFFMINWILGLVLGGIAVWTTWDYIRKGDMAGHVGEGMSKQGLIAKAAESTWFKKDG